ncbi:MAG: hypothetical protein EXR05_04655 [Acetobacteraceae bacterium]|nr:hypothetical protein [Acetobacteraceae bacterium]
MRYQLYKNPSRTIVWNDSAGGSSVLAISGVASAVAPLRVSILVYGRVLARQAQAVQGDYTNIITI